MPVGLDTDHDQRFEKISSGMSGEKGDRKEEKTRYLTIERR
jgi:hypothetical protein